VKVVLITLLTMGSVLVQAADIASLMAQLKSDAPRKRSVACEGLGKLGKKGEPALAKIAMLLATDQDGTVRVFAAQALGQIALRLQPPPGDNPGILVNVLTKALSDNDVRVRLQAAQALGYFGKSADPASKALGEVATSDGDVRVRHSAIATLGTIGHHGGPDSKKALPFLKTALADPDPEIRRLTAYALSRFGEAGRPLIPKLIETLRTGPAAAQHEAARTLGGYGPSAIVAVPLLFEKLKQETHFLLRTEAAGAIVRIDPTKAEEVVKILIVSTRSDDSGVRLFALGSLVEVMTQAEGIAELVRPALKHLQADKIVEIRGEATRALGTFGQVLEIEPAPERQEPGDPEILLKGGNAEEAKAALAHARAFLAAWKARKYDEALLMVDARLRLAFRREMVGEPLKGPAIDTLRIFRRRGDLRARAQVTRANQGRMSLDLVFREGKWWITGG